MKINIRIENEILGDNPSFWQGDEKDISQLKIKNICAYQAAQKLCKSGFDTVRFGMWIAEKMEE